MPASRSDEPSGGRSFPLRARLLATAVAAAALVLVLVLGLRQARPTERSFHAPLVAAPFSRPPELGLPVLAVETMPDALRAAWTGALRDRRVDSAELPHGPVAINFWASWCAACREEAPLLERAWRREGPDGALVLGVDVNDSQAGARAFLRRFGVRYPSLRESGDSSARRWEVSGLPSTFFLSARGRVIARTIGRLHPGDVERGLAAARAGRVPAGN